jgi:integrase
MQRASYQQGSVVRKPRSIGPEVWVFRYMDGEIQRSEILGTVDKFKTKAAARKEADKKLEEINERLAGVTLAGLCDRFKLQGEKQNLGLRPDTFTTYKSFLRRVRAELGQWRVDELIKDIEALENWVNGYEVLAKPERAIPDHMAKGKLVPGKTIPCKPARPASKKTKLHVKAFLHLLFECAMKWKIVPLQRNPLTAIKVLGRKKRVRKPNIITRDQWIALTTDPELCSHVRTMIFVAMLLGLRASEILGLRWDDFYMKRRIMRVNRSQVGKHTGDTKTEGSEEELPIHGDLFDVLETWKA